MTDPASKPTDSAKLTRELAAKIQQKIMEGNLREGDFFMTEAQIAAEFGASRRVAREAVSRLRAFDLLRSRRRKGLVVGQANPVGLLSGSMQFFGRNPDNVRDLAIFRYTIEVGAAELAVANINDAQASRMRDIAHDYDTLVKRELDIKHEGKPGQIKVKRGTKSAKTSDAGGLAIVPEHLVAALESQDYLFHRTILDATGSPLIAGMHQVLMDYFRMTRERMLTQPPTVSHLLEVASDHVAIASAFTKRDARSAGDLLKRHLSTIVASTGLRVP